MTKEIQTPNWSFLQEVGDTGRVDTRNPTGLVGDPAVWNLPATLSVQQDGTIGLRQYTANATGYTISVSGLPTGVTYNAGTESLEGASTGTGSATATFTLTLGATTVVDTATVALVEQASGFVPASGDFVVSAPSGFVDGATITVTKTGGGFGAKPNGAKPLYFFDFADGVLEINATHSRNPSYPADWASGNEISTAVVPTNGTYSVRKDLSPGGTAGPGGMDVGTGQFFVYAKRYNAFSIVENQGALGFNWKPWRLWNAYPYNGDNNFLCGYQGSEGLSSGRMYPEYALGDDPVGGTRWMSIPQSPYDWESIEVMGENSSIDQFDATMVYTVNGRSSHETSSKWNTRTTANPGPLRYLNFDQVSNGTDAGPNYTYLTDIYFDDSWCRIVISDESTWKQSMTATPVCRREIQLPISWSDGSVSFNIRQGAFSSLSGKYLYVLDATNAAHYVGRFE